MYDISTIRAPAANKDYSTAKGQDHSMAEYKWSIYNKIQEFAANADREDMVWVTISDEGFAAMKQNPAYEAWVLDKIRHAYDSCASDGCASWVFLSFGSSETDYKETIHSRPDRQTRRRIMEREKAEKEAIRKKRKKQLEKKILEEKWLKQKIEKTYVQLKILDHRIQVQEENKALYFGADFYPEDHSAALYSAAKRRASAYEATFIYHD